MIKTIISHDVALGKARIRFEHNGVTYESNFSLKDVVPGTRYVFDAMGIEFTEEYQEAAINKLEETITKQIESGMLDNPPPEVIPEYTPPPESTE